MMSLRFRGPIESLSETDARALFDRTTPASADVAGETARIIADVRARGDAALRDMARRFDRVELDALEVSRRTIQRALDATPPALRGALERAAANIESVHRAFAPTTLEVESEPGVIVGRRPDPLERVGVYAPGGRACYPSSVLMGAVPARAAGVCEVIVCSPPDSTGTPPSVALAAAAVARVDRVFAVGGAGAVAALALGTDSVPRVDAIVGPGNAYVAAAKLQLVNTVRIDSPAGPSELVVIADASADARDLAAEMVAQAEHDPWTCVIAVVTGEQQAMALERAIARALADAPRRLIVEAALAANGGILWAETLSAAVDFANAYAPEHLLIASDAADDLLQLVRNAGTVFLGDASSVAFGDYITGANHVLPTGGAARAYSGLSPLDFVRWTTYQRVDRMAAARMAPDVMALARAEGLPGHATAAARRGAP
jgi:histidinol dehydrogenase